MCAFGNQTNIALKWNTSLKWASLNSVVLICFSCLSSLIFHYTVRHGFVLQVIQIFLWASYLELGKISVGSRNSCCQPVWYKASTSSYSILFILAAEQNEPLWNRQCQPFLNQVWNDFYCCCKLIWNRISFLFSAKILMPLISTDLKHYHKHKPWHV